MSIDPTLKAIHLHTLPLDCPTYTRLVYCCCFSVSPQPPSQVSRACPDPPHHHLERDNGDGDDAVALATLRWVRSTVIGLNLCPWAGAMVSGSSLHYLYSLNYGEMSDTAVEG